MSPTQLQRAAFEGPRVRVPDQTQITQKYASNTMQSRQESNTTRHKKSKWPKSAQIHTIPEQTLRGSVEINSAPAPQLVCARFLEELDFNRDGNQ